jgi:hypothetical protein
VSGSKPIKRAKLYFANTRVTNKEEFEEIIVFAGVHYRNGVNDRRIKHKG